MPTYLEVRNARFEIFFFPLLTSRRASFVIVGSRNLVMKGGATYRTGVEPLPALSVKLEVWRETM